MGLVLPQEVTTTWVGKTAEHLRSLGYPDMPYRSKVTIDVLDLPAASNIEVSAICDFCGDLFITPYNRIGAAIKQSVGLNCKQCKRKRMAAVKDIDAEKKLSYQDESWLRSEYIENGRTIQSIAEEFCVSHQAIEKYLTRYGLRKRPQNVALPTKDELLRLYTEEHIGVNRIAAMFPGVGSKTIFRLMDEYQITIYAPGELMSLWWMNDGHKQEMSKRRTELWNDDVYREKTSRHFSDPVCIEKQAKALSMRYQGQTEDEWTGFLTPQNIRARNSAEYQLWRHRVFERDDYRCRCCGRRSSKGSPVILHAHHIENFAQNEELRYDIDNGITLCRECHDPRVPGSFHYEYGTMNNNSEQFSEFMTARGLAWPHRSEVV